MFIKGLSIEQPNKLVIKEFELTEPKDNEVQIKTALVGICGSDIAYYTGKEKYLGDDMFGHEGIGEIVKIGNQVKNFQVGDYVSSSWHPAFREYFNAPEKTCFKIPELSRKYILQCVSCPMNAWIQVKKLRKKLKEILIIGSGFTAYTFAQILDRAFEVYGKFNRNYFSSIKRLKRIVKKEELRQDYYEVIINCDITLESYEIIEKCLMEEGIFVHFATPRENFITKFEKWNWKNFVVIFPSPRAKDFSKAVEKTFRLIQDNKLNMDLLYSKGYDFSMAPQAFDDFVNRRKEGEFKYYLKFL